MCIFALGDRCVDQAINVTDASKKDQIVHEIQALTEVGEVIAFP